MFLRNVLVLVTALTLSVATSAQAQMEVVISQDSCVTVDADHARIYFTITNLSPDYQSICSFQFTPDPSPASVECTVIGFGGEDLWVGSSNLDGGVWFGVPPTEYSYACLGHNDSQSGFYITIDPSGNCCYEASFTNNMYETWWTMSWCVESCGPVPVEPNSWGVIKRIYE
ncbi:MAG: hypothetical protein JSW50_01430 [Candidatus Latescibacterota bacterium]|nr:MAG: hypothetical protein JSW50_01430 [Candidatus Latescibacterota bacterium]